MDELNRFLDAYYGQPAAALRKRQAGYAGPASAWPRAVVCAQGRPAFDGYSTLPL
jgi:hypothetical protein